MILNVLAWIFFCLKRFLTAFLYLHKDGLTYLSPQGWKISKEERTRHFFILALRPVAQTVCCGCIYILEGTQKTRVCKISFDTQRSLALIFLLLTWRGVFTDQPVGSWGSIWMASPFILKVNSAHGGFIVWTIKITVLWMDILLIVIWICSSGKYLYHV